MANEGVLERAEIYVAKFDKGGPFPSDGRDAREIIDSLAAEVRELRKDRERLDWLERNLYVASDIVPGGTPDELGWREAIDAAMKERSD